jgi:hypothetical protein
VKILIHKIGRIMLFFREGMTFVAASLGVEKVPPSVRGVGEGILVTSDEMIEGRIEGNLGALVGCDSAHQICAVDWASKDSLE